MRETGNICSTYLFFTLTNISHIFPIYLVVIREAHSVNKLWQWCVFDEDCFFVALSKTNTSYHVLFSTAWSSQRSVPRFSTHTPIYTHIHTHIHTHVHTIRFSFFKIEIWITWTFFWSSFDRISKCKNASETLISKYSFNWELK